MLDAKHIGTMVARPAHDAHVGKAVLQQQAANIPFECAPRSVRQASPVQKQPGHVASIWF
jgi:hypothetical protein